MGADHVRVSRVEVWRRGGGRAAVGEEKVDGSTSGRGDWRAKSKQEVTCACVLNRQVEAVTLALYRSQCSRRAGEFGRVRA